MEENQKKAIIEKGKEYFRSIIIPAHLKNVEKLHLKSFNVNPFLVNYLASFLCGDTSSMSLAKALIYPRILGTSINTSFGQNLQVFISSLAEVAGRASGIDGIDIEFTDALDGRTKYCQCKAGPQTINADDVATIMGHFGTCSPRRALTACPCRSMISSWAYSTVSLQNCRATIKISTKLIPCIAAGSFGRMSRVRRISTSVSLKGLAK